VTIPANSLNVFVTAEAFADNLVEGTETITVTVLPGDQYSVHDQYNTDSATIRDVPARVFVASGDADAEELLESDGSGTFDATKAGTSENEGLIYLRRNAGDLSQPLEVDVSVGGDAGRGSDYELRVNGSVIAGDTFTFPSGESYVEVIVRALKDDSYEPSETVSLTVSGGGDTYVLGTTRTEYVTILESDRVGGVSVESELHTYDQTEQVTVSVTDEWGDPMADQTVTVADYDGAYIQPLQTTATTNQQGRATFDVRGVGIGTGLLAFQVQDLGPAGRGEAQQEVKRPKVTQWLGYDSHLYPGQRTTATFVAVDAKDRPLADKMPSVWWAGEDWNFVSDGLKTRTNALGRGTVTFEAKRVKYKVWPDGGRTVTVVQAKIYVTDVVENTETFIHQLTVRPPIITAELAQGSGTRLWPNGPADKPKSSTINVKVQGNEHGQTVPVAGVEVKVADTRTNADVTVTRANGGITDADGEVQLTVTANGIPDPTVGSSFSMIVFVGLEVEAGKSFIFDLYRPDQN